MTVDEMLPYLKEHREELLCALRSGKYKPKAVRRVEIPKPDGGKRKLGVPTVIDRMIQQAIIQVLQPIYEPLFQTTVMVSDQNEVHIRQSAKRWNTTMRVIHK